MKKILSVLLLFVIISCNYTSPKKPKNLYHSLPVSILVDSIILNTKNMGNEIVREKALYQIQYNNFYTIYDSTPFKFKNIQKFSDGKSIKYLTSFSNKFNTTNENEISIDAYIIIDEKDIAESLIEDSLYTISGTFDRFLNSYRGYIHEDAFNKGKWSISFPILYIKPNKIERFYFKL